MATSIAVLGAGHIGGNLARLLVPWGAVDEALARAGGPEALASRIVVDTTNQFGRVDGRFGVLDLGGVSAAAYNAAKAPDARWVKAFNTLTAGFQASAAGRTGPDLAAYAVSFLTILILWVNHHALFHAVARVDRAVLFLNGLLLLAISFISVPTAILGRALEAGSYARSAAALYAATFAVTSGCFVLLWLYLRAHPALLTESARPRAVGALRRSLVGPALYTVAVLVALVNATAAVVVAAAVAGYFAVTPRHLRRPTTGVGILPP